LHGSPYNNPHLSWRYVEQVHVYTTLVGYLVSAVSHIRYIKGHQGLTIDNALI